MYRIKRILPLLLAFTLIFGCFNSASAVETKEERLKGLEETLKHYDGSSYHNLMIYAAPNEAQWKVSKMSKEDVAKEYHYYFDLNDIQRNELAARGYDEAEIAKIDRDDFEKLESNWVISKEQIFFIKDANPELENVDISNWTNADVHAYRMSLYEINRAATAPSQEQAAELEKRNISLDIAWKMLRDYKDFNTLLSQSDDILYKLKEQILEADRKGEDFIKYKKAVRERYFSLLSKGEA